ncbi:MAG: hypothetical protein K0S38_550 [Candidatus Paceibacter sp.]|jgi:hypothetical protein|nr:hypothetical protein [Candidatus Paceibacter sp.]
MKKIIQYFTCLYQVVFISLVIGFGIAISLETSGHDSYHVTLWIMVGAFAGPSLSLFISFIEIFSMLQGFPNYNPDYRFRAGLWGLGVAGSATLLLLLHPDFPNYTVIGGISVVVLLLGSAIISRYVMLVSE